MRVQDSNLNSVSISTRGTGRTDATQTSRSGSSAAHSSQSQDQLSLSDLGNLVRTVSGDSPERASHVNKLAAEFKSGGYKVNSSAVAGSIVNDALRAG
ncbi:MAG: flagellar biosynthesis anti-sigma factor FlgM [Acidobacteria bacterium]|nr:flagellar biosynthesis anti-sigma factor FlgM [Acidobacteriota bacterium]